MSDSQPHLSIAAVERDTGIGKDTLRVWERRYGFPQPKRDAFDERSYPQAQVEKLRTLGVPEAHIQSVLDIARHIRDEAGQQLDAEFEAHLNATPPPTKPKVEKGRPLSIPVSSGACCTPTSSGQSCC